MIGFFMGGVKFEGLVDYLHSRIDNTILGRRNISRGIRNFEAFDEYKMEPMAGRED
jgi:hypothetical protein